MTNEMNGIASGGPGRRRPGAMWPAAWLGLVLALASALVMAATPRGAVIEGRVTRVVDGDSLWFAPAAGGAPIEVRLLGIDAPEICQEGGAEARLALTELVGTQPLALHLGAAKPRRDGYGRTLGTLVAGGVDLNRRMVEEGHAWSDRYRWDRGPYVAQERMAQALRRGVHRGRPMLPREFRRQHGRCEPLAPAGTARPR